MVGSIKPRNSGGHLSQSVNFPKQSMSLNSRKANSVIYQNSSHVNFDNKIFSKVDESLGEFEDWKNKFTSKRTNTNRVANLIEKICMYSAYANANFDHLFFLLTSTFDNIDFLDEFNNLDEIEDRARELPKNAKLFGSGAKFAHIIIQYIALGRKSKDLKDFQKNSLAFQTELKTIKADAKKELEHLRSSQKPDQRLLQKCDSTIKKIKELQASLKEEQTQLHQFEITIQRNKQVLFDKGFKKFTKLGEKLGTFSSIALIVPKQICKNFFKIFASCYESFRVKKVIHIQKEWTHHLQAPVIYHHSNFKTDQQVEDLLSHLKDCKTIEDVVCIFKRLNIPFDMTKDLVNSDQDIEQALYHWERQESIADFINEPIFPYLQQVVIKHVNGKHQKKLDFVTKWKAFQQSLANCQDMKQLKKVLKKAHISLEMPAKFEDWNELYKKDLFKEQLKFSYFQNSLKMPLTVSQDDVQGLLDKRENAFNEKVQMCKTELYLSDLYFIIREVGLSNSGIHKLRKRHLYSDELLELLEENGFPDAKTSGLNQEDLTFLCSDNFDKKNEFFTLLAKAKINHQETVAKLSEQSLRQSLLLKGKVEQKFLHFQQFKHALEICFSMIQLFFFAPVKSFEVMGNLITLFLKDLLKINIPGLSGILLFYPNSNLQIFNLFVYLIEVLFSKKYKPNEYSLKGYLYYHQIYFTHKLLDLHKYRVSTRRAILNLKIKLTEYAFFNRFFPLTATPADLVDAFNMQSKNEQREYEKCIKDLKEQLEELRFQDTLETVSPSDAQDSDCNPFEIISEAMQSINSAYLPQESIDFFTVHLNIDLHDKTTDREMQDKLEDLFNKTDINFVNAYVDSRFEHVTSTPSSFPRL